VTGGGRIGAVEVHGATRASFLLRGALAAAGAVALAGADGVTGFVARAFAESRGNDADILNFVLTLEYLEADFYAHAKTLALGAEARALAQELGEHEEQHVEALQAAVRRLGGRPARRPRFVFPDRTETSFVKLAVALEDTGVSAYNGAIPRLASREIRAAAATIAQVEARHAAAVRLARGGQPAPDAFDGALDSSQVAATIRPLLRR
jgi:rubrerythrin